MNSGANLRMNCLPFHITRRLRHNRLCNHSHVTDPRNRYSHLPPIICAQLLQSQHQMRKFSARSLHSPSTCGRAITELNLRSRCSSFVNSFNNFYFCPSGCRRIVSAEESNVVFPKEATEGVATQATRQLLTRVNF